MAKITLYTMLRPVSDVLGLCLTDSRVVSYINRAQERLVYEGEWLGTFQRMRICVVDSCLTWPREVETINQFAISGVPGQVRNEWYEFLEGGPGAVLSACNGNVRPCYMGNQLIDRGQAPAFDDVRGTGKKLAVYCDEDELSSAYIILRFRTDTGEKARSGSPLIEGERFTLDVGAGLYQVTTNECGAGGLYEVVKTATSGMVRLYEYDTVAATYRPLAYYEPDETVPLYRRSLLPALVNNTDQTVYTIDADCRLRFIPAASNDDVLMIQHAEAIRLAVQAIAKEEKDLLTEANQYWAMANRLLNKQLESYLGHGTVIPIRMASPNIFGAGIRQLR